MERELALQAGGGERLAEPLHVPEQQRTQPGRAQRFRQGLDQRRRFVRHFMVAGDRGAHGMGGFEARER